MEKKGLRNNQLSEQMLTLVSKRVDPSVLINTAEDILGNPMAVGRIDMDIKYVSKGMPEDSIIAGRGPMKGFDNEDLLSQMESLAESYEPVLLAHENNVQGDKYPSILAPIRISGLHVGYLSIQAVNREHDEDDILSAKIIAESLQLLFQITGNPDFYIRGDLHDAVDALIQKKDPEQAGLEQLKKKLQKEANHMRAFVVRYMSGIRANAISQAARDDLCNLLDTRIYVSVQGELTLIGFSDISNRRDELDGLLKKHHVCMGVSYLLKAETDLFHEAYFQARAAVLLARDMNRLVFLEERLSDYFAMGDKGGHSFNQMIHPAAFALKEYDDEHGTHLCRTARTYFENKQSIKTTALILGVHVNTVNQRFSQMANLLRGYKFCSGSLFDFYLSLLNCQDG